MCVFIFKSEIIEKIGVPKEELRKAMNILWFEELKILGYKKTAKKVSPKVFNYLKEKYGVE